MMLRRVYICDYQRTPIGRYGGVLFAVRADDLATVPVKALMARSAIDWAALDQVIFGAANQAGRTIATWRAWLCFCRVCPRLCLP